MPNPIETAEAASMTVARQLLESGQFFVAYEEARKAMAAHPAAAWPRHFASRALTRLGAVHEARAVLAPLLGDGHRDAGETRKLLRRVRDQYRRFVRETGAEDDKQSLDAFASLLTEGQSLIQQLAEPFAADEETLGLAARAEKDVWRQNGALKDLQHARDLYREAATRTKGIWTMINAATLSCVLGNALKKAKDAKGAKAETKAGQEIARQVIAKGTADLSKGTNRERFWTHASLGEACLLLGQLDEAVRHYTSAAALETSQFVFVSVFEQLALLRDHGITVPDAIWQLQHLPTVLVFSGHMLDRDPAQNRFSPELEPAVRRAIDTALDEMKPEYGFVSAACGGDLIFAEAMLDRDAELHIALPFAEDDFLRTSVAWAGPAWVRRYQRVCKLVGDRVSYATREPYLGTDDLFEFTNRMLYAAAAFKAYTARTKPSLLAAVVPAAAGRVGGTASVVNSWYDRSHLRIIDLRELAKTTRGTSRAKVKASAVAPPAPLTHAQAAKSAPTAKRKIKTIMFADVVGYSGMEEHHVPQFMFTFLARVAERLREVMPQPELINTWGDAIFAIGETADSLVKYALALQDVVCQTKWEELQLPVKLSIRIGLHAGPVFSTIDPVTGRPNFFGSHVNRAARIEPITVPNHIYASEQFVALLIAEYGSLEAFKGFAVEYLGRQALAKNYGDHTVYHVRPLPQTCAPSA